MAIDRFSKARFEAALPRHKKTGEPIWHDVGFENGEFVYGIDILKSFKNKPLPVVWVNIMIRSSLDMNGIARATGKDSIRLYFMKNGKSHGSKLSCYVTRVNGWEERLTKQLRIMYKRGIDMKVCSLCGGPKAIFKKAKGGDLFQACPIHFSVTYEDYKE